MSKGQSLLPPAWNDTGAEPKPADLRPSGPRLKDAKALSELYAALRDADAESRRQRAMIQEMIDGEPPYEHDVLVSVGQADRCNVNFLDGQRAIEMAEAAFLDMLLSGEHLVSVQPRLGATAAENQQYKAVLDREITRTIREASDFQFAHNSLVHQFVTHGVGIAYFEQPRDWHFRATGLDGFLVPRMSRPTETGIDACVIPWEPSAPELYRRIEDEQVAEALGWNVPAVKQAILDTCATSTDYRDWDTLQAEIKNNEIVLSAKTGTVKLLVSLVTETDGRVSAYVGREDGKDNQWLFSADRAYDKPSKAFILFPFGHGTNGFIHGIRGLGYRIYPMVEWMNRLRGQVMDAAMLATAQMIQPKTEQDLTETPVTSIGPFSVMAPNYTVVERQMPDLKNSAFPAMTEMGQIIQAVAGQYTTAAVFQDNREKTRYEIAASLENTARLSEHTLALFGASADRLYSEMVSRMARPDYVPGEPGFDEIADLWNRLEEQGVPREALWSIDHGKTRFVRSVGAGSAARRIQNLERLTEMMGMLDPAGRNILLRMLVQAVAGLEVADALTPEPSGQRPPVDLKIAQLENVAMWSGNNVDVLPNDMHDVQAEEHIRFLEEKAELIDRGELDPVGVVDGLVMLWQHAAAHVDEFSRNPMTMQASASLRERVQQLGEVVNNTLKKVRAMQRREKEQGAAAEDGQAGAGDDLDRALKLAELERMQATVDRIRAETQAKLAKVQAEIARDVQKGAREERLADIKGAALLRKSMLR